jgi:hypothetical protein
MFLTALTTQMRAVCVLTVASVIVTSCTGSQLTGEVSGQRYISPVGFSCSLPERNVKDGYKKRSDNGLVEFYSDFNLRGIYYAGYSSSKWKDTDLTGPAAQQTLEEFLGAVIFPRSRQSEILYIEPISVGEEEMLIAAANVPEGSGASNLRTGTNFDAKVVALLFFKGSYMFAFTTQDNMQDVAFKSDDDLTDIINNYRSWLESFYEGCLFD